MPAICIIVLSGLLAPGALPAQSQKARDADRLSTSGYVHVQWRYDFHQYVYPRHGFLLRRGRVNFRYDLAEVGAEIELACDELNLSVKDAFLEYRVARPLRLVAGLRKMPFSREELTPFSRLLTIERSAMNDAFSAGGFLGRDIGLALEGELFGPAWPVTWAAGVFNGNGTRTFRDINNAKQFVQRVTAGPLPRLTVGFNATQRNDSLTGRLVHAFGGDLQYCLAHGTLTAEVLAGDRGPGRRMAGGTITAGYRLGAFEPVLQVERWYPDWYDALDAVTIVTIGGNWYPQRRVQLKANLVSDIDCDRAVGHKFMLQAQVGF